MAFEDIVEGYDEGLAIHEGNIREAEERFGVRFPEALREFFLKHNGAIVRDGFALGRSEYIHGMSRVRCDGHEKYNHEVWVDNGMMMWRRGDQIQKDHAHVCDVPFLYDDGGNDFVCDTSTPLGAVYYVPLDGGCERSPMLCESLQEFLDSIEVRLPGSW